MSDERDLTTAPFRQRLILFIKEKLLSMKAQGDESGSLKPSEGLQEGGQNSSFQNWPGHEHGESRANNPTAATGRSGALSFRWGRHAKPKQTADWVLDDAKQTQDDLVIRESSLRTRLDQLNIDLRQLYQSELNDLFALQSASATLAPTQGRVFQDNK